MHIYTYIPHHYHYLISIFLVICIYITPHFILPRLSSLGWLIGRNDGLNNMCHIGGFPCQKRMLKTFPGPGYLLSEDGTVWLWHFFSKFEFLGKFAIAFLEKFAMKIRCKNVIHKTQWYTLKLFTVVVQRVLIVNFNNSNKYTVVINSLWRAIAKCLSGYYWALYLCWIRVFENMKISWLFVGLWNILNSVYLVLMATRAKTISNICPKIWDFGIF